MAAYHTREEEQAVKQAVQCLQRGGVLLHLSDTVWGLAADAGNKKAVEKLRLIKGRSEEKAFILLLSEEEKLKQIVGSEQIEEMSAASSMNRPCTIIYPLRELYKLRGERNPYEELLAKDGSLAIRLVREEKCGNLLRAFGSALVSSSANKSGAATPGSFSEIDPFIIQSVDYVLPAQRVENKMARPSRILKWMKGRFEVIRE